jgi:hypothetical protein
MQPLRRIVVLVATGSLTIGGLAGPAGAHPHVASTSNHDQVLANGQNHPGFQPIDENGLRQSCAGILETPNSGPAGFGLETAHHGPDAGAPGKADGCYATLGNPTDSNPAID